jgi:predicted kinase
LKDWERVNLDTLKTRHREKLTILRCQEAGRDYVVDNTNPTREDRARYIAAAKAEGYRVIGCYMQSVLKECIARNDRREGRERIPAKAIAMTSNRLQLPRYDEGFDELYYVANDGETMTVVKWEDEP